MDKLKSTGLIVTGVEICNLRSHCLIISTFTNFKMKRYPAHLRNRSLKKERFLSHSLIFTGGG
jgi:hypothetical protein